MWTINSSEGRWSISLCTCTQGMTHFTYGNATLHILVRDLRDLGMAMQRMAEDLNSQSCQNSSDSKRRGVIH